MRKRPAWLDLSRIRGGLRREESAEATTGMSPKIRGYPEVRQSWISGIRGRRDRESGGCGWRARGGLHTPSGGPLSCARGPVMRSTDDGKGWSSRRQRSSPTPGRHKGPADVAGGSRRGRNRAEIRAALRETAIPRVNCLPPSGQRATRTGPLLTAQEATRDGSGMSNPRPREFAAWIRGRRLAPDRRVPCFDRWLDRLSDLQARMPRTPWRPRSRPTWRIWRGKVRVTGGFGKPAMQFPSPSTDFAPWPRRAPPRPSTTGLARLPDGPRSDMGAYGGPSNGEWLAQYGRSE